MGTIVTDLLRICTCCMLVTANGECGEHCHDAEPLSKVESGFHVTLGLLSEHHSCGRERGETVDECECEQLGFSMSPCDGCGSSLHGDRFAATLWDERRPFLPEELSAIATGYVDALLWSESCNGTAPAEVCDHLGRGEDCDASLQSLNYDASDLADDARTEIETDVADFVAANADDIGYLIASAVPDASYIGHNLLLSRNGHGTGFWDRGWLDRGDRLHAAAEVYGGMSAYVGGDGKVHVQ